jgi:ribosome maturation factor RimP
MFNDNALERELTDRVAGLGFELVELERAGTRSRPILRVRIDRPGSEPGRGVSIDDCARVSRELESLLDAQAADARYVLEVSSPGVERPLIRRGDYERFGGHEIAVMGRAVLAGRARRLEGQLLGISGEEPDEIVTLRLPAGDVVEVRRGDIERAHLVFRWP